MRRLGVLRGRIEGSFACERDGRSCDRRKPIWIASRILREFGRLEYPLSLLLMQSLSFGEAAEPQLWLSSSLLSKAISDFLRGYLSAVAKQRLKRSRILIDKTASR